MFLLALEVALGCFFVPMKLPLFLATSVFIVGCATRPATTPEQDLQIVEAFRVDGVPLTVVMRKNAVPRSEPRKTLAELEAEELKIRKDYSVSGPERMRRLQAIWKEQLAVTGGAATVVKQNSPAPSPAPQKTLIELEAEELRIRKDHSVSGPERMRRLRAIWKEQLAVMGK